MLLDELFCAAVAAAVYASSIWCGFVFDDRLAIVDNPDVQSDASLVGLLFHDFWGKALVKEDSHKSYRPLTILSFRAHTWLSGTAAQPAPFHAANVVLHATVSACVTALAARSWPSHRTAGRRRVALLSGMLFAVHPVHVEAVTGVVGRAELLCALCCFGGARAYVALSPVASPDSRALLPLPRTTALTLCVALCFAAAVLCKETGVTLLGILGARELAVVLPARGWRGGRAGSVGRAALLGCCAVGYAVMRLMLTRPAGGPLSFASASLATSGLIRRAENPLAFVNGRLPWLLSVARVQFEYARLLLWPATLSIEYSYDCVPMATDDLADLANLAPALLALAAAAAAAALQRALTSEHCRHTLAAAAWLIMPWVPISHVPLRLGTLVAERTLYMPSVGAMLLLANALCDERPADGGGGAAAVDRDSRNGRDGRLGRRGGRGLGFRRALMGRAGAVPVGLVVGLLATRTLRRTLDWRTDESAFEAAIEACPRSAKLHQQMCTLRTQQRRLTEAAEHCAEAIAIDPEFCDVQKSLGFLALASEDVGHAIGSFNESLGCVYTNVHSYKVLLSLYDLLHQRDPQNATLHEQMGTTQAVVGNAAYAATLLREAAALYLRRGEVVRALAAAERGAAVVGAAGAAGAEAAVAAGAEVADAADAADAARRASAVAAMEACALAYWRGQALRQAGRWEDAREAFEQATPCDSRPALGHAAATEAKQLTAWLRQRARLDQQRQELELPPSVPALPADPVARRVLLLSFHGGVAASVRWAADEFGWKLDVPDLDEPSGWLAGCQAYAGDGGAAERGNGDGGGGGRRQQPSALYRFTEGRARCLWTSNGWADRLAEYDLVIVADTAPLAWPLLIARWPEAAAAKVAASQPRRPSLLLWVCNRFDYGAVGDAVYYDAIRDLAHNPSVAVVSSAAFEWRYAKHVRGVEFPSPAVLRPAGLFSRHDPPPADPVPATLDRSSSFFVLPKVNEARLGLAAALAGRGVPVWTPGVWPGGMQKWGGPAAVAGFRAAVHVPYAPTTFALFEHASAGLLTFIPSARLLLRLYRSRGLFFQATAHDFVTTGDGTGELSEAMLSATEWYDAANADCFIEFDSLDDLHAKLKVTDYAARRQRLRAWAEAHANSTRVRWRMLDHHFFGRSAGVAAEGSGRPSGVDSSAYDVPLPAELAGLEH